MFTLTPNVSNYFDIESKLSQVDDLKKSLNGLTNENNCKTLLENLCTGLEKFLGFNSESKGYDGTGIVYSDLDRLCDAVMGFLSGVLSNIKEHLGQHKNTLDDAINTLNTNKHLGKKGFNVAIGKVVEGVRKYNGFVKTSNERLSDPIKALLTYLKTENNGEFITRFNAMQVASVSDDTKQTDPEVTKADNLVTQCVAKANTFNDTFDINKLKKNLKKDINDLNHKLRERVHSVRETVKYETDRLTTLSRKEKENYDAIVKMVKKLEDIKSCVKSKITDDITKLVNKLKKDVKHILNTLESISNVLAQYVKDFDWWMKETDDVIRLAEEKVEKILEEVYKDSDKKKAVSAAANMIRQHAFSLREAGDNAKTKVAETVKLALQQVKSMDEAIKKDLKTVKDNIKAAVQQLGTTLVGNVKEGLWTIESAITGELGEIVSSSGQFFENFKNSRNALQAAIGIVMEDILNLGGLKVNESIKNAYGDTTIKAPLLQVIGQGMAFSKLKTYFNQLDTDVMQKIKEAMRQISEGMESIAGNAFRVDLESCINKARSQLVALHSIAENPEKVFQSATLQKNLRRYLGDKMTIAPLNGKFSGLSTAIKAVTTDLAGASSIDASKLKNDLKSLLSELGNIAQIVSSHSADIVKTVIEAIVRQLTTEIGNVSDAIKDKVDKIRDAITYNRDNNEVDYGAQEKAKGLLKLQNVYGTDINERLKTLQGTVTNEAFKHTYSQPRSKENYEFGGTFMEEFKTTYEKNLKDGDFKTDGGTGSSVLDKEIGGDSLRGVPDAAEKIAGFENDKFTNYRAQVDQDSLARDDPNQLDGQLPKKIKAIREQVEEALTSIQSLDDEAQKQLDAVNARLDELCKAVTDAAEKGPETAKGRLTELKRRIGRTLSGGVNSLMSLNAKLKKLQDVDLQNVIRSAEMFLKPDADKAAAHVIDELTKEVDDKLTEAKKELTKQANTHYVTTLHYLLQQFADKVRGQLDKLPDAIEEDLTVGFKGFMGAFQGQNGQAVKYDNIEKLKDIVDRFSKNPSDYKENFEKLANKFQSFWQPLHDYVTAEIKRVHAANKERNNPKPSGDGQLYTSKIDSVTNELNRLLNHLSKHNRYDYKVPEMLDILSTEVHGLHPESFSEPSTPLLETVAHGFRGLVDELGKAYVSVYDGASNINWDQANNPETTYCAKIFLTAFSTIYDAVHDLRINCNSLKGHQIHSSSDLGRLFLRHGFRVSESDKQHWELQNKSVINGEYVANRISFRVDGAKDNDHLKQCESNKRQTNVLFNLFDILECILYHIDKYNAICHIAILPKPRTPCTVFEMLVWLSGLTYTSAYQALLSDGFTNVLDNPEKPLAGDGEISVFDIEQSYLEAHPQRITYKSISKVLEYLCSKSYDLLTTVVGHGDAATFYACDYSNNTLNLYYPSSGEECLQMLLDFLRRILQPLRFLFERCSVADKNYGWADCHYGRDVPTTKSHCNNKPTEEVTCIPNCQPNCEPKCQPTSPLMNYLSDSLLGYLPHRLESVGCKSKCSTCPSTSRLGMPCVTPLGFRAFSGSTKTGRQLREMIREFLGSGVVSSLFGLSPTPPKTLPEHFSFGLSLVNKWVKVASYITDAGRKPVSQTKIEASIQRLSIKLYTDTGKLTNVLRDAYGNSQHEHEGVNHLDVYADVSSLCMTNSCTDRVMRCAPYLSTLCSDTYEYLVHKNFATYLTWAVYLPWDFWTQLNNLCNAFKNISCQDWGCHTCLRADKCKRGQHGLVEQKEGEPAKPHCKCESMVQCKGVSATLYQFGFCFGNAATLNNETSAKSCSDFCSQLDRVLKSEYFVKLFTECDNFIWTIREPFTYMVLALWSLSLLYLLCVMVGRLDVLHIRSHLRSPSSHKITAQSLLAAAQVGRLAKISYLQP
ncbi:hypothetical protein, conserved [Babesia bigemina]|uniref:C3H1-type domain-containing protein n=1 Tax=Babesia bigemina TaxID=5866 RepID=A0A061BM17_BABBI|nr:hypothetical protein, conserved [Babesia bigemina]CDR71921.1 hypothetical protein, conserved [Babesia bigemina]|eukprot:XP_012770863.1 hypothetical protein, conserved [Babesia bigemina]